MSATRPHIVGGETVYLPLSPAEETQRVADAAAFTPVLAAVESDRSRNVSFKQDASRIDWVDRLRNATPQQIETYITNNVTNLAQARTVLIGLAKVLAIVVKE